MLAAVFLLAVWVDDSQPTNAAPETYALLIAYAIGSILVAAAVWNSWWRDALLSGPAHIVDIMVFTLLMFGTQGYTSPFFLSFVFILLAAAIRRGWRETAMTAAALIALYVTAGATAGVGDEAFEWQRFIIRGGHLLILSAILIWFGVNQGVGAARLADDSLPDASLDESPLQVALDSSMLAIDAGSAMLVWHAHDSDALTLLRSSSGGEPNSRTIAAHRLTAERISTPFLFDLKRDRALTRDRDGRTRWLKATQVLDRWLVADRQALEGLAIPLQTETASGLLLLCDIDGLSVDQIDVGRQVAAAIEWQIQRHALLAMVKQTAVTGARASLSRDLHDSIVQFLAGATFRVEAASRAARLGEDVVAELAELKRLLLEEQQELRSAIGALRKDEVPLPELAEDIGRLCARLSRQWDVDCSFTAQVPEEMVPMNLHLDTHQLVREAVANAVRHAGAKVVRVKLSLEQRNLLLEVTDEGGNGESSGERLPAGAPWSLRERVDEANGTLMLASRDGATTVSVKLPLRN